MESTLDASAFCLAYPPPIRSWSDIPIRPDPQHYRFIADLTCWSAEGVPLIYEAWPARTTILARIVLTEVFPRCSPRGGRLRAYGQYLQYSTYPAPRASS